MLGKGRHTNYNINVFYSTWTIVKEPELEDSSLKSGLRIP